MCMFCWSLFVLLYFLFWALCCLTFDIQILITSLWYLGHCVVVVWYTDSDYLPLVSWPLCCSCMIYGFWLPPFGIFIYSSFKRGRLLFGKSFNRVNEFASSYYIFILLSSWPNYSILVFHVWTDWKSCAYSPLRIYRHTTKKTIISKHVIIINTKVQFSIDKSNLSIVWLSCLGS